MRKWRYKLQRALEYCQTQAIRFGYWAESVGKDTDLFPIPVKRLAKYIPNEVFFYIKYRYRFPYVVREPAQNHKVIYVQVPTPAEHITCDLVIDSTGARFEDV